jgi:hypothetical protein
MKIQMKTISAMILAAAYLSATSAAQDSAAAKPVKYVASSKAAKKDTAAQTEPGAAKSTAAPAKAAQPAAKAATSPAAAKKAGNDTLVIVARISEIPGKFPPNDLYNYVYIMKYRVLSIVKGSFAGQDILVGQYNPLIPRKQLKDKMAPLATGDADKFEVGLKHKLTLVKPVEKVWKDAVEDEYQDSDMDKYYALKTEVAK